MKRYHDFGHLFRLASVFAAGILAFLVFRGFMIPHSFGQYGHYRGDAIKEIAAKPVVYAGREACETCHTDVAEAKQKGKHARIGCESCHGPLAAHADDPGSLQPEKLDTAVLCVRCHEASSAKPKWFPQVVSADHASGLACNTCHQPHSPVIDPAEKDSGNKKSANKSGGRP